MDIRPACDADLPELAALYNDILATSTAVFSEVAVTVHERRQWLQARAALGYPVLVAVDGTSLLGFATFGDFRPWPGFRYTVEHSVHVRQDRRGRGVGSQLMTALLAVAEELGKHVMVAGIDGDNLASRRFHERLGFEFAGQLNAVGYKFGRFLDLVFLQKRLAVRAVPWHG